jgi:hypothetical protein
MFLALSFRRVFCMGRLGPLKTTDLLMWGAGQLASAESAASSGLSRSVQRSRNGKRARCDREFVLGWPSTFIIRSISGRARTDFAGRFLCFRPRLGSYLEANVACRESRAAAMLAGFG